MTAKFNGYTSSDEIVECGIDTFTPCWRIEFPRSECSFATEDEAKSNILNDTRVNAIARQVNGSLFFSSNSLVYAATIEGQPIEMFVQSHIDGPVALDDISI